MSSLCGPSWEGAIWSAYLSQTHITPHLPDNACCRIVNRVQVERERGREREREREREYEASAVCSAEDTVLE